MCVQVYVRGVHEWVAIYIYRAKEREAGREGGRDRERERAGKLESERG